MVAILDYGAGNVTSVKNILNLLNADSVLTNDINTLEKVDKIIFPGVGHAEFAMQKLLEYNLIEFIQNYKKPFLGICLGLQLMCEYSEEGNTLCLGIFPTKVKKFPSSGIIPHMGWNNVNFLTNNSLFRNIPQDSDFYFVHSYYVEKNPYEIAKSEYIIEFCSSANKKNFFGVQFHPEKSSKYGLKIIENFLSL